MTPIDTARLAVQALKRYPLRSSMLLLAIAIGVAAVITLTAVGEGARRFVAGEFEALGTNMLIVLPGRTETTGAGLTGMLIGETARDLTLDDTAAMLRSPNVQRVAPIVLGGATASWRQLERDIYVIGATASLLEIQHWEMGRGRFLPNTDLDVLSPVCVLGHVVASELFGQRDPIGEWIRIGDSRFRVIGILAEGGLTSSFNTDESIMVPVANAQQIFNSPSVLRVIVEATSLQSMNNAKRDILDIVTRRHQGEEDITVILQDAVLTTFDSVFGVITGALAAIAAVSLVVAGVLIMNVMLVAVTQRTSEIGLLKALGAKQSHITGLFLTEACCLSLLGGLIGFLLGSAATFTMRTLYPIIDFQAPVWAALAGLGVAVASGLLFGIWPARRAAALDPVHALAKK